MLKKILSIGFLLCCLMANLSAQAPKSNKLVSLLNSRQDLFGEVLKNPAKYEVQIIYTQIDRDAKNRPAFHTYEYRVNKGQYFYPASTVKFPVALLALERLNQLNIKGLDKYTPMFTEAAREPQEAVKKDSTAKNGLPSVAQYVKKLLIVSDNDAFNRLYEFLGQAYINNALTKKGYKDAQIIHRLATSKFNAEENKHTNPVYFEKDSKILYKQSAQYNLVSYPPKTKNLLRGKGYINARDELVEKPFDFTGKNYLSLAAMHEMLRTVMFPASVKPEKRFNLTADDYLFLHTYMSMLPKESKYPIYPAKPYQDAYVKYIQMGDPKDTTPEPMPTNIRVFNKVGLAYGYSIENAYVVDFEAQTEYMISAVIYTNEDRILNDGKYEYDELAFPFFSNLGKVIGWYEKNRPRKFRPDLSLFKVSYEER